MEKFLSSLGSMLFFFLLAFVLYGCAIVNPPRWNLSKPLAQFDESTSPNPRLQMLSVVVLRCEDARVDKSTFLGSGQYSSKAPTEVVEDAIVFHLRRKGFPVFSEIDNTSLANSLGIVVVPRLEKLEYRGKWVGGSYGVPSVLQSEMNVILGCSLLDLQQRKLGSERLRVQVAADNPEYYSEAGEKQTVYISSGQTGLYSPFKRSAIDHTALSVCLYIAQTQATRLLHDAQKKPVGGHSWDRLTVLALRKSIIDYLNELGWLKENSTFDSMRVVNSAQESRNIIETSRTVVVQLENLAKNITPVPAPN